jgi:predicted esterase
MIRKKFLILHGFGQDETAIKTRMKSTMSHHKNAEYHFLLAPHVLPDGKSLAWFAYDEEKPTEIDWDNLIGKKECKELFGLDESLEYIVKHIALGSYDAILGFSQGAAMLALLTMHIDLSDKLLIFVGGFIPIVNFKPLDVTLKPLQTLHVIGKKDTIVKPCFSEALASIYKDSRTLIHNNAHVIPKIPKHLLE